VQEFDFGFVKTGKKRGWPDASSDSIDNDANQAFPGVFSNPAFCLYVD